MVARVGQGRKPQLRRQPLSRLRRQLPLQGSLCAFLGCACRGRRPRRPLLDVGGSRKKRATARVAPTDIPKQRRRGDPLWSPLSDMGGRRGNTSSSASPHPALRATFPSRGRQHLIRPCGPPPPEGEALGRCFGLRLVGAGVPDGPCWTGEEDGGTPPHPPRSARHLPLKGKALGRCFGECRCGIEERR